MLFPNSFHRDITAILHTLHELKERRHSAKYFTQGQFERNMEKKAYCEMFASLGVLHDKGKPNPTT